MALWKDDILVVWCQSRGLTDTRNFYLISDLYLFMGGLPITRDVVRGERQDRCFRKTERRRDICTEVRRLEKIMFINVFA